jgi:autotransporter passenger strand-loop-strand repeat protein
MAVRSGGVAISTTVRLGGLLNIRPGGSGRSTVVFGNESIFGFESRDSIGSDGEQDVNGSGTATSTAINNGGFQDVLGGAAILTTIKSGGLQVVFGSGLVPGATNGMATSTIILSGGIQKVRDFGTAISTTINNGGIQTLFGSGSAISTTIKSGGIENVNDGTDSSARISGGTQFDYGLAIGATVFTGSQVISGGTALTTTVKKGGIELVSDGGFASGGTISSGGILERIGSNQPARPPF